MTKDGKRRLPVLKSSDDEEQRPAKQWIAIGAIGSILASLPLLGLMRMWAASRLAALGGGMEGLKAATPSERLSLGMIVVLGGLASIGIGAFLGGMLVGRFGGEAGKNEGTFAGVAAGVLLAVLSLIGSLQSGVGFDALLGAAVTTVLAGVAGRGGAVVGLKLRS
jgi:hypothetical protein